MLKKNVMDKKKTIKRWTQPRPYHVLKCYMIIILISMVSIMFYTNIIWFISSALDTSFFGGLYILGN